MKKSVVNAKQFKTNKKQKTPSKHSSSLVIFKFYVVKFCQQS